MFEGNEDVKVEGRSLVDILWVEVGTEIGPVMECQMGGILENWRNQVRDRSQQRGQ